MILLHSKKDSRKLMTGTTNSKTALITGITAQDGSYLAEFLIKKGYYVHGELGGLSPKFRWTLDMKTKERLRELRGKVGIFTGVV